jgi:hypothetical protein
VGARAAAGGAEGSSGRARLSVRRQLVLVGFLFSLLTARSNTGEAARAVSKTRLPGLTHIHLQPLVPSCDASAERGARTLAVRSADSSFAQPLLLDVREVGFF